MDGWRGRSRSAVRLSVAALVAEFRPSARPLKVVVGAEVDLVSYHIYMLFLD